MGEVYQEKTHESDGDLKPDPCMMILEVGDMIDNHWTDGNWCLPLVQAVQSVMSLCYPRMLSKPGAWMLPLL